ncbi:putative 2,3-bisphosphoglycerate-dependent phosphoglycerate mutase [Candidatus Nitrososphaera gargensis Ga9.2]|uniref:Putative 2,3-bisphosphoglycerate-dependent phosphoglycerate mutase n=1 Tax=Nitrososphaera gargensis (strain Ga9.2) TaxID=1237085 RepID=K0IJT3_NITGG|nr:histidine phosphatase family protein [Candidatus Nitrososphaera gargensis]AFU59483.1 putative 2,3-bisphosphoglycerate-dependent phosphoglycerate mutase [Candidatus Nitrososphaera gargensis Ga9.2]
MPLVIFMRHGQAENNVSRILVGRHIESHLTSQGRQQVADAAKQLKSIPIDKIYASPVIRAVETAQIVCETLGMDYEIDERLYEIELGKLVGMNYEEVTTKYGDLFLRFYAEHDPVLDSFGVEPFSAVKQRVKNLLDDVLKKYEDSNVLMVTHLDPIKAALATLLDLKPEALYRWHIRNASLTVLKHESKIYSLSGVNVMAMHRYPND